VNGAAALILSSVSKRYGRTRALDGLDLSVPRGSIFGLIGSNGAGKTTTMAVAVGLLGADAGAVDVLGAGQYTPQTHAGRVSLLPQDARFPPHARVDELLLYYARLQGLDAAGASAAVSEVLEWVHLADRRRSPVRTLSHGMHRRLSIAQAFLGRPELVLLDEPLNGLDPREAARVRDLIRARRGRQTIVISSHNLTDIEALCDTVAFLEHGRRVRQDSLDAVTGRRHTVAYLLARPIADGELLRTRVPEAEWLVSEDGLRWVASFQPPLTVEAVNARVASALAAEGGLLEIRRGSDLESVYLGTVAG
jgi:ABC-type multidrug transport system ATPase subunit